MLTSPLQENLISTLLKWLFIIFFTLNQTMPSHAQDIDLTTHDSQVEGLYFDQALIYSYSDHTGLEREVWIYHSTCSGRFLFDHAAWGREDEMIHYVIAQPDGSYLTFGTEAEGPGDGKVVTVDSIYLEERDSLIEVPLSDEYVKFIAKPERNRKVAGLESKAYEIQKLKSANGTEEIFLAEFEFDTRMLYQFNTLGYDLRIPQLLGNMPGLGSCQLITQYESTYTDSNGQKYWSKLELKTISPTTYWAPFIGFEWRRYSEDGTLISASLTDKMEFYKNCD